MLSEFEDIKNSIKDIALNGEILHSILCYVQEVDAAKFVCSVYTSDGLTVYNNVRLKEITDTAKKEQGTYLIPVKDSRVIIDFIGTGQAYVAMVSEVEKVITVIKETSAITNEKGLEVKQGKDLRFAITSKGMSLENKSESKDLRTILDTMLDFFAKEYIVQTAWGPSGPAMSDAASKIDEFKKDLGILFSKGGDNATT